MVSPFLPRNVVKLSTIQETLAQLDVRPSKRLGQNFLHDQNLAGWITAQLDLEESDCLVEIGPGLGALTERALGRCRSAILIEKDRRLAEFLRNAYASEKVEVIQGDAVDFDVGTLFERAPVKVLGNLPYCITSPILFKFTAEPSPVQKMVFTIQRELAQRLTAEPSTKEYGALTVIIHRRWRVNYLRTLPGSVFLPRPKVDSAVISLVPREPGELPECDGTTFDGLVKTGFSQRRKQLRKFVPRGVDWQAFAAKFGIPAQARAEELTPLQWIELANAVHPVEAGAAQNVHGELFDVVDEGDRVIASKSRHEVHTRGLLHRAVHVFVFNRAGELFLQKRSRWKDAHPSRWDSSAAGHVDAGRDYDETAVRELREELGIEGAVALVASIPASDRTGHEFVHLYKAENEGPFVLARSEIECGEFFPVPLIRRWIRNRPQDFATGFIECLRFFEETRR